MLNVFAAIMTLNEAHLPLELGFLLLVSLVDLKTVFCDQQWPVHSEGQDDDATGELKGISGLCQELYNNNFAVVVVLELRMNRKFSELIPTQSSVNTITCHSLL